MAYLDENGLTRLWAKIKGLFAGDFSTTTYTSFLNDFTGSVVVCKKAGVCYVHGYVKPSSVSTSWVDVMDAVAVPAPQHGANITPTVGSWSSASDAAARVRVKASGGLAFARGTANKEFGFSITYPIAA